MRLYRIPMPINCQESYGRSSPKFCNGSMSPIKIYYLMMTRSCQHNFFFFLTTVSHRIGGSRELSRESSNADRCALKQRFRLQFGNLKRQFAIENAIFNRFRSALVDSRNSLRLPPIQCEFNDIHDLSLRRFFLIISVSK